MTEIDVTLTDYALALLNFIFATRIAYCSPVPALFRRLWTGFFISAGLAALAGGTVHGFFSDGASATAHILWLVTTLAIGVTASSAWIIGGLVGFGARHFQRSLGFASVAFAIYACVLIFYSQSFTIVIINYLPATLFLLGVSVIRYFRKNATSDLQIALGLIVTLAAAIVQQTRLQFHPEYFNYNATYHVVQAVGLYLVFLGAKKFTHSSHPA